MQRPSESESNSLTLGTRLRIRLNEWRAEGRISWADFADVMADAISDMAAAVDLALEDRARYGVDAAQARHVEIVYQLLKTAPYSRSGYYAPRDFATFESKPPAPDFYSLTDVVDDVNPANVPDLPGLADVAPEPELAARRSHAA